MADETPTCPRDGTPMDKAPIEYYPVSLVDNETHICGDCNQREHLFVLMYPTRTLRPLTDQVFDQSVNL